MQELEKVLIRFKVPSSLHINQNLGSVMQGVLMEQLTPEYSSYLHRETLRPYSQFVMYDKSRQELLWNVTALNKEAVTNIIRPLRELPHSIYLKNKHASIDLLAIETLAQTDYEQLLTGHMINTAGFEKITFNFLTSTTFKSEGVYQLYPNFYYIFNSLLKRWQEFAPREFRLDSHLDLLDICRSLSPCDYSLHYRPFALEQTKIPGFTGK